MSVASFLASARETAFSFEVLPPLKGGSIGQVCRTVELLREFCPAYVNITTHRSEVVYRETAPDVFVRVEERHRPGTVAIAATLQAKYGITPVPHLICSGYTQQETEYQLIDLAFLGITDLLVLRGDKGRNDPRYVAKHGGLRHASELCAQVNRFNEGQMLDGTPHRMFASPDEALGASSGRAPGFSYGVAGYPELHEEAHDAAHDLEMLRRKVAAGAGYVVTQMFFDNACFFDFVARCRAAGIGVPIVPGIKPLGTLRHRTLLPQTFHLSFPEALRAELARCHTDEDVKTLGVEWAVAQCRELKAAGVPSIHFYSMNAAASIARIARVIY